jgi:hypothetical protein
MLVCEVADPYLAADENFRQQAQAIEQARLRVEQLRALRIKLTELNKVPRSERNSMIADELGVTVFNIFNARSELAELKNALRQLRYQEAEQARARAPALQLAAPTAPEQRYPATHIQAGPN